MNTKQFLIAIMLGLALNARAMTQPISEEKLLNLRAEFNTALANERWDRAQELIQQAQQGERAITAREWQKTLEEAKKNVEAEKLALEKANKQMEEMAQRKAQLTPKEAEQSEINLSDILPTELKLVVLGYLTSGKTFDEVIKNIRSIQTNKEWAHIINDEKVTRALIDDISKSFKVPKYHVAIFLETPGAEKWLAAYIKSKTGDNEELADITNTLLWFALAAKTKVNALALAGRAIRAMNANDPSFSRTKLFQTFELIKTIQGNANALLPSLIDKVLESKSVGDSAILYQSIRYILKNHLQSLYPSAAKALNALELSDDVYDLSKLILRDKIEQLYPILKQKIPTLPKTFEADFFPFTKPTYFIEKIAEIIADNRISKLYDFIEAELEKDLKTRLNISREEHERIKEIQSYLKALKAGSKK